MGFTSAFEQTWAAAGGAARCGDLMSYTPAAYLHPSANTVSGIYAVLRQKYVTDNGVEMTYTAAVMPVTKVASPQHKDWLECNGVKYKVRGVQPDGAGHNILELERA